jgi:hypothetical protein
MEQRQAREHQQIRHSGPAEVEPEQSHLPQRREVRDSVASLKAKVGQRQFPQGRQVRDRRSRNVQAEGSVAVDMQALVLDPVLVKPTSERRASVRCGVPVICVTREKRGNASDTPVARVQSPSLAVRVSILNHVIRATSPAGRATGNLKIAYTVHKDRSVAVDSRPLNHGTQPIAPVWPTTEPPCHSAWFA